MIRDLTRLANDPFDALVIGGGVYGLATAWELASRGLQVALVDRGDFGGATSFNSLKTVHGGIRALQHGAVAEMREFVRERRALATIAPHLVRPLPFIVPTYRHPVRNRLTMGMFFAAYDRLASDRNAGVDPSRALPASRTVARDECLRLSPAIDPDGVTGGAIWYDYQMHSPERFAMALLCSMRAAGGAAANYASVDGLLTSGRQVRGVQLRDRLSGSTLDVRAKVVVNAAGPGAWAVLQRAGVVPASVPAPRFSLAMNLVVAHPPQTHAAGGLVHGRFLFLVPWRDRSIVGTSHDDLEPPPEARSTAAHAEPETADGPLPVDPRRVSAFLHAAAAALPRASLDARSIRLVHRGLLPAGQAHGSLLKRSIVHDHRADGLDGLVTVIGVRYTTARATAQAAGDSACRLLGSTRNRSSTSTLPLTGGDIRNVAAYEREQSAASSLPAGTVIRLIAAYGTGYGTVARLIEQDSRLGAPLSATCRVTRAEIVHSARAEMAVHLTDALLRRTEAGTSGHPGPEAVAAAADVMAAELRWTPAQRVDEIAAVDAFYNLPALP
jgi:glycerol-3-phosphate dehydrogenase